MQSITYFNPLQPTETKSEICNYKNTSDIRKEFQFDAIAYELVIAKNNEIIIEDCEILDNDVVSVMVKPRGGGGGGGKEILATVAMVALVVAAPGVGWAAVNAIGSMTALSYAGAMAVYGLATAGVMIAGGMLINAVLPPSVPDIPSTAIDYGQTSQTYSWEPAVNSTQQGDAMPRLFGTLIVTPRLISKYVESINDKQYLNALYLVNDGLISSLSSVKINSEDLANFNETNYEFNYGLENQQMLSKFDDIFSDKLVSKKILYSDYSETNTDGDAVSKITATLTFPRGLYYANDDGSLGNNTVKIIVQYSIDQINWTQFGDDTIVNSWKYWALGFDNIWREYNAIEGTATGYTQSYAPAGAQYVKSTGSKFITTRWYKSPYTYSLDYTTITNNTSSTFRKTFTIGHLTPNKYYIRAKFYTNPTTGSRYASDCYFEYLTESTSYDFTYPGCALLAVRALATDQLSGSLPTITCKVTAGSSNPAVIVKTILTECGISEDRFSSNFDVWETYCDDNNLECHIYFDAITDVRQAINYVSTLGRASVLQFGSKFDVIIDKAEIIPTQGFTFGMGNILKDTFKQTFLPLKDRANIVEVSYYDIENEYQKTAIEIASEDYDTVLEANKSSVNLIGCVSRTKAIEHAKLLLNSNRYLTQTFTFQADIDSLVCKVGDIVRISHDVPQYGFSGRLVSATTTGVVLDREITFEESKSYYLQARRNTTNEIIEVEVSNTENTTNSITFITAMATALSALDNYSFGEINKVDAKARVLNIRTTSEFLREITCVEYNESVYDLDHEPVVFDISSLETLENLRITEFLNYDIKSNIRVYVDLAWSGSSLHYDVSYTANGTQWTTKRVYDQFMRFDNLYEGIYYKFKIVDTFGNTLESDYYQVLGKLSIPEAITNFTAVSSIGTITFQWDENKELDFKHYEIVTQGQTFITSKDSYIATTLKYGTYDATIYAVDTGNRKSDPTTITYLHNEKSIADLIDDAYLIEQGFLDGKINMFFGGTEPTTPANYDLWVVLFKDLTLNDIGAYNAKQYSDYAWNAFDSKFVYKYYVDGFWYLCTDQQSTVIQRMLRYVTVASSADGLVRIFKTIPFAPYDVGDLWIDGDTIKTCTTSKRI